MTCLPRRLESTAEGFEDGGGCFFADLNPEGGLYGCGPGMLVLRRELNVRSHSSIAKALKGVSHLLPRDTF